MKNRLITLSPYIAVLATNFYLLPFFAKNTGAAMILMRRVMPLNAMVTEIIYCIRNSFNLTLPILTLLLFLPTVYLYYNVSAWIYAVGYAAIVLIGMVIGKLLQGKQ